MTITHEMLAPHIERLSREVEAKRMTPDEARTLVIRAVLEASQTPTEPSTPQIDLGKTDLELLVSAYEQEGLRGDAVYREAVRTINDGSEDTQAKIVAERARLTAIETEKQARRHAESPEGKAERVEQIKRAKAERAQLVADSRLLLEDQGQFSASMLDSLDDDDIIEAAGLNAEPGPTVEEQLRDRALQMHAEPDAAKRGEQ